MQSHKEPVYRSLSGSLRLDAPKTNPAIPIIIGGPRTGTWLLFGTLGLHPAFQENLYGEYLNLGPGGCLRDELTGLIHDTWADHADGLLHGLPDTWPRINPTGNRTERDVEASKRSDETIMRRGAQYSRITDLWGPNTFQRSPQARKYLIQALRPGGVYKILYDQLPMTWLDYWAAIREQAQVRLLHIRRKNSLDVAVSYMAAQRSGIWARGPNQARPIDTPFRIAPDALHHFFATMERHTTFFESYVTQAGGLLVDYDQLVTHWEPEIRRIHNFIGIAPLSLHPISAKRTTRSPRELLCNYEELEQAFSSTRWANFFGPRPENPGRCPALRS